MRADEAQRLIIVDQERKPTVNKLSIFSSCWTVPHLMRTAVANAFLPKRAKSQACRAFGAVGDALVPEQARSRGVFQVGRQTFETLRVEAPSI